MYEEIEFGTFPHAFGVFLLVFNERLLLDRFDFKGAEVSTFVFVISFLCLLITCYLEDDRFRSLSYILAVFLKQTFMT